MICGLCQWLKLNWSIHSLISRFISLHWLMPHTADILVNDVQLTVQGFSWKSDVHQKNSLQVRDLHMSAVKLVKQHLYRLLCSPVGHIRDALRPWIFLHGEWFLGSTVVSTSVKATKMPVNVTQLYRSLRNCLLTHGKQLPLAKSRQVLISAMPATLDHDSMFEGSAWARAEW